MRGRCLTPSHKSYKNYGGRGITITPRWDSFAQFVADMGDRPAGRSLDRIDNNAGYGPDNCRWATRRTQNLNSRMRVDNKSGVPGVWWWGARQRWKVDIDYEYVGVFDNLLDAVAARLRAAKGRRPC